MTKHYKKLTNCLTKLVGAIPKYKIIGFDIETHGDAQSMTVAGIYDEKYKKFLDKQEFINYVETIADKNIRFIATNLGFDFQGVFYDTEQWSSYKLILKGSRTLSAKSGNVQFSDTMNYTPASVKTLGRQIGLSKLRYTDMLGKVPRTRSQWYHLYEYNARDCLVSKKWTEQFQEALNSDVFGCEMKLTIASTALDFYRRRFIPRNIYKEKFECKDFIMKGYYGGRVECFSRGKLQRENIMIDNRIKYYWYDYNSAYPYQMLKEYPYPESARMTTNGNVNTILNYHGTSEITFDCPYMKYPLLPYRLEHKGTMKLIFPYGENIRGVYNHIEIRRAIELGYKIKQIHKTLYYTETFYPFKDYVTYLYNLRLKYKKEGNTIYSEVCKLLMNSLYGKLASKENIDITFIDNRYKTDEELRELDKKGIFDNMQPTQISKDGKILKGYKEVPKENDSAYILPILSSCVTSYQRVQIHTDLVNLNGLYCDTDSILTTKKINDNMELGGLKLEKEVSKGWLIRPKCYMIYDSTATTLKDNIDIQEFKKENPNCEWINERTYVKGWNTKVKGINKCSSEDFYNILIGKPVKQIKFAKIKEAMKRGYKPNKIIRFTKIQSLEDDKRMWLQPFDKDKLQESRPIHLKNGNVVFDETEN